MKKILLIALSVIVTLILILVISLTFETGMGDQVKVGEKAPVFATLDIKGNNINLENYKGKKVFLAFFRFAGCPICNYRVHELINSYDELSAKGIEVIAIFESSNETLNMYTKDADIPFVMISDPDASIYKQYGVGKSISKMFSAVGDEEIAANGKKGDELFDGNKYEIDGSLTRTTADILVNENGMIQIAHYGQAVGDHIVLSTL